MIELDLDSSEFVRAGLIQGDGRVKSGAALYAAVRLEIEYLLSIPAVPVLTTDLIARNADSQEAYRVAAEQNQVTANFRFAQSQARFFAQKINPECLMDTVMYFHQVGKIALAGLDNVLRWVDISGPMGCFGWNDGDFISQVKFLDRPRMP